MSKNTTLLDGSEVNKSLVLTGRFCEEATYVAHLAETQGCDTEVALIAGNAVAAELGEVFSDSKLASASKGKKGWKLATAKESAKELADTPAMQLASLAVHARELWTESQIRIETVNLPVTVTAWFDRLTKRRDDKRAEAAKAAKETGKAAAPATAPVSK